VALASRWLSSCLQDHDCEAPNLTGPSLLTRFLHIGNGSRKPHLVEFQPGAPLHSWAALSYQWGETDPLWRLVKDTEGSLKAGVKISEESIQDAITISRGLGIQYLWIDRLCIFQDRESDWLEQSSQMSYIYGHSTVTIASVDTEDASQSFLRPRETQYVGISWDPEANQDVSEECRNPPQVYVSHSWPDHYDELSGPWSKRAWTLQEGFLPKRILSYSSHQMVWKCCRMVRYEASPRTCPYKRVHPQPCGQTWWKGLRAVRPFHQIQTPAKVPGESRMSSKA